MGKHNKVTGAFYDDVVLGWGFLYASNDAWAVGGGNYISIDFGAISKPHSSTTLSVIDLGGASNPSQYTIHVGHVYGDTFQSTGKARDKFTLSVSLSGKLKASFSTSYYPNMVNQQ